MLGDTAIAVNPGDSRYAHLVGKKVMLTLMGRPIPIIADDFVDPAFGTGLVKVTMLTIPMTLRWVNGITSKRLISSIKMLLLMKMAASIPDLTV
jgi:valyl-tRNA synthetase